MSHHSKSRQGGVLPVAAAATKKATTTQKSTQKAPGPKLRLIIRRLPPGLVEVEFWEALGSDWKLGKGNVEWFAFKTGKISRDPSKPSKPARAYLKVKDQSLLETLSAKVRQTQFRDARNSGSDPCLMGPPSLEFAPHNKTPGGRMRNDGRQGTIDQDPEFIDFLQSLTQPITKSAANSGEGVDTKQEKVTTTPLIQFIKEKKANKAKEKEAATAAKNPKKAQDPKEGKSKGDAKPTVIVKSNLSSAEKTRSGKAAQDVVKSTSKPATTVAAAAVVPAKSTPAKSEQKPKEPVPVVSPAPKRPRERGNVSAAAKLISRDLGLIPKEPRASRAAKTTPTSSVPAATTAGTASSASNSTANSKGENTTSLPAQEPRAPPPPPAAEISVSETKTPPTGPRIPRTNQQPKQQQGSQKQQKSAPQPSAGAKSAFLKHANISQGITEELLRTTFGSFGEVARCEIDKKKGLGYIDFTNTEALKKAMAASPIKIANGQVTVLENRSPYRKAAQQKTADTAAAATVAAASEPPTAASAPATNPSGAQISVSAASPATTIASLPADQTLNDQVVDASIPNTIVAEPLASKTPSESSQTTPRASRGNANATRGARGGQTTGSSRNNTSARAGGRGGNRGAKGRGGRGGASQNASGQQQTAQGSPAAEKAESTTDTG